MQKENFIVGFDLCDDYSQVSYQISGMDEPKTVSTSFGSEKFQIPTVLLRKENIDKWYFGMDALKLAESSEGLLVKNILKKCNEGKSVYYNGEEYTGTALLEIFIKKVLRLISYDGVELKIPDAVMFTVKDINRQLADGIKQAAANIGIDEKRIYITTHEESFVDYTMSLEEDLHSSEVLLLEYENENLKWYILKVNERTKPVTMKIQQGAYEDILPYGEMYSDKELEEKNALLDKNVYSKLEALLKERRISCAFIVGDGFKKEWAKQTLRFLCSRSRVFQGKNLFSKGACIGAGRRENAADKTDYLYLGPQKLMVNVGIELMNGENEGYYSLISAGENWYEASADCEVIIEDTDTIEVKLIPIDKKDIRTIIVHLNEMPKRPPKTNRMRIQIDFKEESLGIIRISDMGFGEFFKKTDKVWEHKIVL